MKVYLLFINLLTYSMEQNLSWEASSFSASQEIPAICGTRKFITAFTSARHMSLSWDIFNQRIFFLHSP